MGAGKRRTPVAEIGDAGVLEQVGLQIGLHHPQFAQRVGDRGAGGEGGDPLDDAVSGNADRQGFVAAPLAQYLEFQGEVFGPL